MWDFFRGTFVIFDQIVGLWDFTWGVFVGFSLNLAFSWGKKRGWDAIFRVGVAAHDLYTDEISKPFLIITDPQDSHFAHPLHDAYYL